MMTEDTSITITLTKDEVLALAKASDFYMNYIVKVGPNEERSETAHALASYSIKILPLIQQKSREEHQHG